MSKPPESGQRGARAWAGLSAWIRYPAYAIFGVVLLLGIIGGFTTAVESTNSLEFCTSCHDMSYNFEEYKKTIHYSNPAGVRAVCSDCHVPKRDWFSEMRRKAVAARDVWVEILGTVDTHEKFEAHRLEMAKREWARMKESDSIGCRNCHSFESMALDGQDKLAAKKHARAAAGGSSDKTCIDCHKGIAHKIPKSDGGEES
jgi:nitrate/TMAO reductase-like tetraheme cytochrome c subunit